MRHLALAALLFSSVALAGHVGTGYHPVRGYVKKSGTYVVPHYAKNPRPHSVMSAR